MADAQDVMDAASGSAEDLEKNAKGAGKGMEDGGKGAKTFDVALGTLAGNALSAVISKCGELMEQTKELRRDLSFLEQNARDAGMGMEQLHNKAGELYAVTGDTNEVVEALSNILATGFNDADKAYEVIDMLAGAVVKFPETMNLLPILCRRLSPPARPRASSPSCSAAWAWMWRNSTNVWAGHAPRPAARTLLCRRCARKGWTNYGRATRPGTPI